MAARKTHLQRPSSLPIQDVVIELVKLNAERKKLADEWAAHRDAGRQREADKTLRAARPIQERIEAIEKKQKRVGPGD